MPVSDAPNPPADDQPESTVSASDQPAVETAETPAVAVEEPVAAPEPQPRQGPPGQQFFWGTGRRKRAVARVRVRLGDGAFKINGREIKDFFHREKDRQLIARPLEATESRKKLDVFVNVFGGGTTGQAGAILLGVARALKTCNPDYEQALREGNFLTRDSRKVERKKYGQRGARRRFQFSKR